MVEDSSTTTRRGQNQFIGAAGEYFVAYSLAVENIHAAITPGNALDVDVLVASPSGHRSLVLQVKTAIHARHKPKKLPKVMPWREWTVGKAAPGGHRGRSNLWYVFVDLQKRKKSVDDPSRPEWDPRLFVVPSVWVADTAVEVGKRWFFRLPAALWEQTQGIGKVRQYLVEESNSLDPWVNVCPEILKNFKPRCTLMP